jgi:hypothetical protein
VTFQSISLAISAGVATRSLAQPYSLHTVLLKVESYNDAGVATPRLFIVCILLISFLFSSGGLFIPIDQLPVFIR